MNRTFQHNVNHFSIVMPVLLAGVAISIFWHRSPVNALIGLALFGLIVVIIERMLHTEYRFVDDRLVISKGRFARKVIVPLSDITATERIHRRWLGLHYVLIRYGAGHEVSVQPQNELGFLDEIRKRQNSEQEYE